MMGSLGYGNVKVSLLSRPTRLFIIVAFLLSWPILFLAFGWFDSPGEMLTRYLLSCTGMLMVGVSAFLVRVFVERRGFKDVGWARGDLKWYVAALLFGIVCWVVPSLISKALGIQDWENEVAGDSYAVAALSLMGFSVVAGFGEEFGWRGYLLARLSSNRRRAREAVVVVGFIWGVWHFPVALGPLLKAAMEGSPDLASMFVPTLSHCIRMVGSTLMLSFIFGAAWLKTKSIFLASFLHGYFIGFRDAAEILLGVSSLTTPFLIAVLMGTWLVSFRWLEGYEKGDGGNV
jgi:membrane protease YdiL (CAAX protease family)